MPVTRISIDNFTVFEKMDISFDAGINVFIGENGVGKTHLMKLIYSACKANRADTAFEYKLIEAFRPDGSSIGRLSKKGKASTKTRVRVFSESSSISIEFEKKEKRWDARVEGKNKWEKSMQEMSAIYIPAKEILSNAWKLESAVASNNVEFDDTYVDIIAAAKINVSAGKKMSDKKDYLDKIKSMTGGKVFVKDDRFYLLSGNQTRMEFNLVSEGVRKIALLWQLINNGVLEDGAVLFWDEPEANINPKYIPLLAELLLMLQRDGVQIFVSTHDYFLTKYFDVKKQKTDKVMYYSLYKDENTKCIKCEDNVDFKNLKNNPIMDTFMNLYKEEMDRMLPW